MHTCIAMFDPWVRTDAETSVGAPTREFMSSMLCVAAATVTVEALTMEDTDENMSSRNWVRCATDALKGVGGGRKNE
jgi:hypothetical protein